MGRRMKRTAGNTILEVIVSLALFLVFTGMFAQFLFNVHHLVEQAIYADKENQELWRAYYLDEKLERKPYAERSEISFYRLDEEGGLLEEGFSLPGISLSEYGLDGRVNKIYVLEQNDADGEQSKGDDPAGTDSRYGAEQFDSGGSGISSDADASASSADSVRRSRRKSR